MTKKNRTIVLAFASLLGQTLAFWRMGCSNIQYGRIDPVVSPGKVSAHVHVAQGSANWGVTATNDTLINSKCTSCEIQADKSAYWTPLLYYQFANGSVIDVFQTGSIVYYEGRGMNSTLTPFPPGFRMVSGDAAARSYDNTTLTYKKARPVADRISFACLHTMPIPETPGFAQTNCSYGLRLQVHFQSCWNGVDLYKSDNSHVAYLSQIDNGECPPTHPYQLVHIFLETLYSVNAIAQEPGGRFVISTGDPTGYSFHADFQNGWNQTVLEYALQNCAFTSDGAIESCPLLQDHHITNAPDECPTRPSQINERVQGLLPKLPGCINIVNGPARAQPSDTTCPTTVQPPAILATPDTKPEVVTMAVAGQPFGLKDWTYVGCANDTNGGRVLQGDTYWNQTNMTVPQCQSFCGRNGFKYAGLEIGYQCFCGNYLQLTPVFRNGNQFQAQCYYACTGDDSTYCGGSALVDIYNNTKIAQLPDPIVRAAAGKYLSKGCWKEAVGQRALKDATFSSDSMTVESCAAFCTTKKVPWFGVEYGRECYCGASLNSTGVAPMTDCNMLCSGNSGQSQYYCGGSSRMNLYYASSLV